MVIAKISCCVATHWRLYPTRNRLLCQRRRYDRTYHMRSAKGNVYYSVHLSSWIHCVHHRYLTRNGRTVLHMFTILLQGMSSAGTAIPILHWNWIVCVLGYGPEPIWWIHYCNTIYCPKFPIDGHVSISTTTIKYHHCEAAIILRRIYRTATTTISPPISIKAT